MRNRRLWEFLGWFCLLILLPACSVIPGSTVPQAGVSSTPTQPPAPTVTQEMTFVPLPTEAPSKTSTVTPTTTFTPSPSSTATSIPRGYKVVPEVVGLHYLEARQNLINAGFTFLYSDVYDPEVPFGTILEQYPPAGAVEKQGEMIFLYRAFQAPGMWVGEKCMPLKLKSASGKLLFAVFLREGERYEIRTDFSYGRTSIFDYRMALLDDFNNQTKDEMIFEPEWTAWYVLSLGPYEIRPPDLDKDPEGVSAGCLWVQLLEE